MQYLLLIYRNEAEASKVDAKTTAEVTDEYSAFTRAIIETGNFKAS